MGLRIIKDSWEALSQPTGNVLSTWHVPRQLTSPNKTIRKVLSTSPWIMNKVSCSGEAISTESQTGKWWSQDLPPEPAFLITALLFLIFYVDIGFYCFLQNCFQCILHSNKLLHHFCICLNVTLSNTIHGIFLDDFFIHT